MKSLTNTLNQLVPLLLIILWVYAALSKLFDFEHFQWEMSNQVFGNHVAFSLTYGLPPLELLTSALLLFEKTRKTGLYISLLLLILFTGYVGLINYHFFSRVPCSCGGILEQMGWSVHFYFNLFFLSLTVVTIITNQRKELTDR